MEFSSVTVSFFIHSTEREEELLSKITSSLGLEAGEISSETIEGYFGNKIISVKAHVTGGRAQEVAVRIIGNLSAASRKVLLSTLEKSVDEHDSLYLRIDRQELPKQELELSDEEPVRVKLKPKHRSGGHQSMIEQYKELIEK